MEDGRKIVLKVAKQGKRLEDEIRWLFTCQIASDESKLGEMFPKLVKMDKFYFFNNDYTIDFAFTKQGLKCVAQTYVGTSIKSICFNDVELLKSDFKWMIDSFRKVLDNLDALSLRLNDIHSDNFCWSPDKKVYVIDQVPTPGEKTDVHEYIKMLLRIANHLEDGKIEGLDYIKSKFPEAAVELDGYDPEQASPTTPVETPTETKSSGKRKSTTSGSEKKKKKKKDYEEFVEKRSASRKGKPLDAEPEPGTPEELKPDEPKSKTQVVEKIVEVEVIKEVQKVVEKEVLVFVRDNFEIDEELPDPRDLLRDLSIMQEESVTFISKYMAKDVDMKGGRCSYRFKNLSGDENIFKLIGRSIRLVDTNAQESIFYSECYREFAFYTIWRQFDKNDPRKENTAVRALWKEVMEQGKPFDWKLVNGWVRRGGFIWWLNCVDGKIPYEMHYFLKVGQKQREKVWAMIKHLRGWRVSDTEGDHIQWGGLKWSEM